MVKIVTDTCSLYSVKEGERIGLPVAALNVNIDGETYREFEEISPIQLLRKIQEGSIPSTSQPSIGEKIELYNQVIKEGHEIIDITMSDGLSGAYQSALMAKDACDDPDKVTVYNSKTLCIPQRLLVIEAKRMADQGATKEEILTMLQHASDTDVSFLVPLDFDFLLRGGRTSNASAFLGGLLKLVPVVRKTDDGKRLEKFSISRTYKKAINNMLNFLMERGVDDTYVFGISHADNKELAGICEQLIYKQFPRAKVLIFPLSPVFISQGGPGCMALQVIKIDTENTQS